MESFLKGIDLSRNIEKHCTISIGAIRPVSCTLKTRFLIGEASKIMVPTVF